MQGLLPSSRFLSLFQIFLDSFLTSRSFITETEVGLGDLAFLLLNLDQINTQGKFYNTEIPFYKPQDMPLIQKFVHKMKGSHHKNVNGKIS